MGHVVTEILGQFYLSVQTANKIKMLTSLITPAPDVL